jgi:Leu/Phe-tRNA-protein transferase
MEDGGWFSVLAVRVRSVFLGEITVIDRCDGATVDLLHIAAGADPIGAQRGQSVFDTQISRNGLVAPGAARVVDADRFVDFDLA